MTDQLGIAEDLREARERIQRQEESIAELRRERDEARARVRELEEMRLSDAEGHALRMDVAIAQHEELRNMYDEQRQRAEAAGAQLAALREAAQEVLDAWYIYNPRAPAPYDVLRIQAALMAAQPTAEAYTQRVQAEAAAKALRAMAEKTRFASDRALEDARTTARGGGIATGRHDAWERASELLEAEAKRIEKGGE